MKFDDLTEGALAGHYRVLRRAKAEGKSKAEAHEIAKKRGAHPNTVEDVYRDDVDEAKKQRLDPKCWDGYKKQGTKIKGGVRVNNCVPESTVNEISDEERAARRADDEKRYKDNPAMLKALRSIEATFGPERKKIDDQILAMMRTVAMLENPRWKDRAWSNVEAYGIDNVQKLVQEIKLMIADEKKAKEEDTEGLIYGIDSNLRQMNKALEKLSQLGESQGWCGICGNDVCTCTDDRMMEQQAGISKVNLENILISMQHDISKGKLIPEHMNMLVQQHNELMEVYEQLENGELTEAQLNEFVPLAALALHGARAAAGAALRTAAGQALKRGAINVARNAARRAGQGLKNLFRRGKAGRRARGRAAGALGGDDADIKKFGDLNLGRRGDSNLSARAAAAGLSRGDIDALGGN